MRRAASIARQGLGGAVLAAEEAQRRIVERLHAERDAVDAGRAIVREAARPRREVGLASSVISMLAARASTVPAALSTIAATVAGVHQRRRAAAEEDAGRAPAPRRRRAAMSRSAQQRVAPAVLVDRVADMAVEVAIGAFRRAERPVDIERAAAGRGASSFAVEAGSDELPEGAGAVADRVLPVAGPSRRRFRHAPSGRKIGS